MEETGKNLKNRFFGHKQLTGDFFSSIFTKVISKARWNIKIYSEQVEWDDVTQVQKKRG